MKVIPYEKIGTYIDHAIEKIQKGEASTSVCPRCNNIVRTFPLPYAYDEAENDVVFVDKCPVCGHVAFTKE